LNQETADHGNSLRPDLQFLRSEMISACDKYLHDFESRIKARESYFASIQNSLSSKEKVEVLKIMGEANDLYSLVFNGKTHLIKARTLEQLWSAFNFISSEIDEKYERSDGCLSNSLGNGVIQFAKEVFQLYLEDVYLE